MFFVYCFNPKLLILLIKIQNYYNLFRLQAEIQYLDDPSKFLEAV